MTNLSTSPSSLNTSASSLTHSATIKWFSYDLERNIYEHFTNGAILTPKSKMAISHRLQRMWMRTQSGLKLDSQDFRMVKNSCKSEFGPNRGRPAKFIKMPRVLGVWSDSIRDGPTL